MKLQKLLEIGSFIKNEQFLTELSSQDATYGAGSRPGTPASRPGSARAAKPSARAADKKPTAVTQKSKSGNTGLKKSASDVRFTFFVMRVIVSKSMIYLLYQIIISSRAFNFH